MVSKPERHFGDRLLRRHRDVVHRNERFDADELERGDIELEEVPPAEEIPDDEQREPWAFADESRMTDYDRARLRLYREFLGEIGEGGNH